MKNNGGKENSVCLVRKDNQISVETSDWWTVNTVPAGAWWSLASQFSSLKMLELILPYDSVKRWVRYWRVGVILTLPFLKKSFVHFPTGLCQILLTCSKEESFTDSGFEQTQFQGKMLSLSQSLDSNNCELINYQLFPALSSKGFCSQLRVWCNMY